MQACQGLEQIAAASLAEMKTHPLDGSQSLLSWNPELLRNTLQFLLQQP